MFVSFTIDTLYPLLMSDGNSEFRNFVVDSIVYFKPPDS